MQARRLGRSGRLRAAAAIVGLGALLAGGSPGHAAPPRVGIAGFAGQDGYRMSDVNDEVIEPLNAVLFGSGFEMDEISGGWGFGGGIRIRPSDPLLIAVDYERLTGGSDLDLFGLSFDVEVPAHTFTGTAAYLFSTSARTRLGIAAGLGYYVSDGSARIDSSGVTLEASDLEGSGVGFHGGAAFDAAISPNVHFEALAGYRYARTTDLTINGEKQTTSDGDDATLDWSGFMSRVGLTFYFGGGGAVGSGAGGAGSSGLGARGANAGSGPGSGP